LVIPLCRIFIFEVIMVTWKELSDLGIFEGKLNHRVTLITQSGPIVFSVWIQGGQIHICEKHIAGDVVAILTPDMLVNRSTYKEEVLQKVLTDLKAKLIAASDKEVGAALSEALAKEAQNNLDRALKNVRFLDLCQGQVKLGPVIDGVQYYLPSNLALVNLETNPALEAYNNLLYKTLPRDPHEPEA